METESQIEGQMKNQIRHLQEDDIDAVAKIWLDTNPGRVLGRKSCAGEGDVLAG